MLTSSKRSCGFRIGIFLVLFLIYTPLLWHRPEDWVGVFTIAGCLAFLMSAAVGCFFWAANLIADRRIITRPLHKTGDLQRVALFGRIYPYQEATRTPFGFECVSCDWEVIRRLEMKPTPGQLILNQQERRRTFEVARGYILVPSYLRMESGDVKLMAWPSLEGFARLTLDPYDRSDDWRKIIQYLESIPLERPPVPMQSFVEENDRWKSNYRLFEEEELKVDENGSLRKERVAALPSGLNKRLQDPDIYFLEDKYKETYVGIGEEVGVVGSWSEEKKAIVEGTDEKPVTLRKGTRDQVLAEMARTIRNVLLAGLLITLTANGLLWYLMK